MTNTGDARGASRAVSHIELTKRQEAILDIVKRLGPITGEQIAERLNLTRATLRPDLSILTMAGFLEARPRVGYFYSGKKNADLFGETLRKLKVKDYKSVPIVITEKNSVYDAIVTMFMEDVGSLIVVRDQMLQGIVSRKDLLKVAIGGGDIHQIPVNLAMTRVPHVVTVEPDEALYEAAVKMVHHEVDSLPVVRPDAEGGGMEVVGRVSKTTIARAFVELGQYREV
ncbi:helix-turn-helix transcriptional regulator [Alicyclobacillus macrosporangiidus]|jgi:CBS domain-containing protein|uniref:CBS domain-containing protein n=1 Tax=Alicyclobacillus macrosporangiidus TaxID=392015 RepID=A0A1I7K7R1_9BACL|nr:helix-turn-helix transcriptional regulator [Alicyclobacillus macrosporangiidus]SFU93484.1 CBS domain-containing protein [Alicyclobacillus macrosporangiidus]